MSFSNSCKDEFWMLDFHLSLQSSVLQLFGKETLKGKLYMRKVGIQGLTIQNLQMQAFEKKSERNMGWRCRAHTKYILNSEHPFEIQSFMFLADILSIVLRSCPGTTGVKMNFEKKGNQDLTIQSSQWQVIKKRLWKEKGMKTVGIQDRPSKIHFHWCCATTLHKTIDRRYPLEPWKHWENFKRKIAHEKKKESKVLPFKICKCKFLKRNFGRNMGWEKKETRMLPFKVHNCRWLKRTLWKEQGMRKVGIQDRPNKIHFHWCCATAAAQNYR